MALSLANWNGRAALAGPDGGLVDLERRSDGRFGSDPMDAIRRWDELRDIAADWLDDRGEPVSDGELGPCVPRPAKVFAIGLNYTDHIAEMGHEVPTAPVVFTKFPSCLTGPGAVVELSGDTVDWEVELVVVIGRAGRRIEPAAALSHVAGYTIGQDLSDRTVQRRGNPPQFSMAKSFDGYGPLGGVLVDARREDGSVDDGSGRSIWSEVNGTRMQDGDTSSMLLDVPTLVHELSQTCTLEPGDIIFTGTPPGVGAGRVPPVFLRAGDELVSGIDGLGTLTTRFR